MAGTRECAFSQAQQASKSSASGSLTAISLTRAHISGSQMPVACFFSRKAKMLKSKLQLLPGPLRTSATLAGTFFSQIRK